MEEKTALNMNCEEIKEPLAACGVGVLTVVEKKKGYSGRKEQQGEKGTAREDHNSDVIESREGKMWGKMRRGKMGKAND